jgi:transposase
MNMHPQGGVANRDQGPNAGIDVSKQHLDACWGSQEQRVVNGAIGWDALIAIFKEAEVDLVVLEATGGYERGLVCALQRADITVARVNPSGTFASLMYFWAGDGPDSLGLKVLRYS